MRTPSSKVEQWELDLVATVARRFRTYELDDLKAELGRRLLVRKLPRQVDTAKRDWPADEGLGRNVSGGTRPRLSWGRSLL